MRKWFIIGMAVATILLAVSVYALQVKVSSPDPDPREAADCSGCVLSSGCGSGSGGCNRSGSTPEQVRSRLERIEAYFLDYYTNRQGLTDITVEIESFGCHEEATVRQAGQVIARYSINGENISPIEG